MSLCFLFDVCWRNANLLRLSQLASQPTIRIHSHIQLVVCGGNEGYRTDVYASACIQRKIPLSARFTVKESHKLAGMPPPLLFSQSFASRRGTRRFSLHNMHRENFHTYQSIYVWCIFICEDVRWQHHSEICIYNKKKRDNKLLAV